MPRSRLKDMKLRSVHLVDAGDNPEAFVLIKKNKPDENITPDDERAAAIEKAIQDAQDGKLTAQASPDVAEIPVQISADAEGNIVATANGQTTIIDTAVGMVKRLFSGQPIDVNKDFNAEYERRSMFGFINEVYDLTDTYMSSLDSAMWSYDDDETAGTIKAKLEKNTEQFVTALQSRLGEYGTPDFAKRVEGVDEGVVKESKERLAKSLGAPEGEGSEAASAPPAGETPEDVVETGEQEGVDVPVTDEQVQGALSGIEDAEVREHIEAQIAKAKEPGLPGDDGLNAEEREMLKGASAGQITLYKRQRDEIVKLRVEKEEEQYIGKARTMFKSLPISPEEFGPVLRRVEKGEMKEGDGEYILGIIRSADAMKDAGSLFDSIGAGPEDADSTDVAKGGSAKEAVIRKARGYFAKNPEVGSVEAAVAVIARDPQNKELVERYYDELAREADE